MKVKGSGMTFSSNRIQWIDIAKTIGIYLMILGHIPIIGSGNLTINNIIYTFHMPLFFFLSGFVDKSCPPLKRVKRCAIQIIVPYIFWYLLSYAYWLVASFLRRPEVFERNIVDAFLKPMAGLLLGVGYNTNYSIMVNIPCWFLPCIFCVKVMYSLIEKYNDKIKSCIVILMFILAILFAEIQDAFLPFSLGTAFMCFPIYYLGGVSKKYSLFRLKNSLKVILLFVSSLILVVVTNVNGVVDVNNVLFGKSPVLFYIGAMSGIVIVCLISEFFEYMGVQSTVLGKNTLTILGLQTIVASLINKIYAILILHKLDRLDDYKWALGHAMVVSFINLCVCRWVCIFINKLIVCNKREALE